MTRMRTAPAGSDGTEDGAPHLVVKRGHRGRYRFMLIRDGEKIGGEVHVGDVGTSDELRAIALTKIARLADALYQGVSTPPAASLHIRSARRRGDVASAPRGRADFCAGGDLG